MPIDLSTREKILAWLREENPQRLAALYAEADATRKREVGDEVFLRGLIEFSNRCVRSCGYCGLRRDNDQVTRYRMEQDEIVECALEAKGFGYGTVVLQSGEDPGITLEWMEGLILRLRQETGLAITLSLGERTGEELAAWRKAGADRYLLRFETSNAKLFEHIHPPLPAEAKTGRDRFAVLRDLRLLGYEVGSGVMVGIPGESYGDLARDIELFRELDLDMIGIGPYLPHPQTPLGSEPSPLPAGEQVPGSEEMVYKAVALTRLVCPPANIPATTALATLNKAEGRELGLSRGANILMPNCTPLKYRKLYEIYPAKVCIAETASACQNCMKARIESIGRTVGLGPGTSPNISRR